MSTTESETARIRLREVDADNLSLQLGNGNGSFLADKSLTKEFSVISHDKEIMWIRLRYYKLKLVRPISSRQLITTEAFGNKQTTH